MPFDIWVNEFMTLIAMGPASVNMRSVLHGVAHVVGIVAVIQIAGRVIERIAISMENPGLAIRNAVKGPRHELMNTQSPDNPVATKAYHRAPRRYLGFAHDRWHTARHLRVPGAGVRLSDNPLHGTHAPQTGNLVIAFVARDGTPLFRDIRNQNLANYLVQLEVGRHVAVT